MRVHRYNRDKLVNRVVAPDFGFESVFVWIRNWPGMGCIPQISVNAHGIPAAEICSHLQTEKTVLKSSLLLQFFAICYLFFQKGIQAGQKIPFIGI